MIVGVDLEGVNVGEPFILEGGKPKTVLREDVRKWIDAGKSVSFSAAHMSMDGRRR